MKNHYVSQFIIKRFSKAINIFDIRSGCVQERKKSNKVFFKEDVYDEEIEKLFNFNIESRVSNIIDSKILVDGDIVLTREDLEVLKRYMLICSVRTLSVDDFCKILLAFEHNADKYISINNEYENIIIPGIKLFTSKTGVFPPV